MLQKKVSFFWMHVVYEAWSICGVQLVVLRGGCLRLMHIMLPAQYKWGSCRDRRTHLRIQGRTVAGQQLTDVTAVSSSIFFQKCRRPWQVSVFFFSFPFFFWIAHKVWVIGGVSAFMNIYWREIITIIKPRWCRPVPKPSTSGEI